MGRATGPDDSDSVMISILQVAPDVKHHWRRVDFPKLFRIRWRFLRDHCRAKFTDAIQLRRKIDNRFPPCNLVSNFVPNPLHCAKFTALRSQHALRLTEDFEQLAQPNRPDRRKHVEYDTSFRGIHAESSATGRD